MPSVILSRIIWKRISIAFSQLSLSQKPLYSIREGRIAIVLVSRHMGQSRTKPLRPNLIALKGCPWEQLSCISIKINWDISWQNFLQIWSLLIVNWLENCSVFHNCILYFFGKGNVLRIYKKTHKNKLKERQAWRKR